MRKRRGVGRWEGNQTRMMTFNSIHRFHSEVPEPSQCRGRLAEAVLLFLVNLTRPIDQRHQVVENLAMMSTLVMTMLKEEDEDD